MPLSQTLNNFSQGRTEVSSSTSNNAQCVCLCAGKKIISLIKVARLLPPILVRYFFSRLIFHVVRWESFALVPHRYNIFFSLSPWRTSSRSRKFFNSFTRDINSRSFIFLLVSCGEMFMHTEKIARMEAEKVEKSHKKKRSREARWRELSEIEKYLYWKKLLCCKLLSCAHNFCIHNI